VRCGLRKRVSFRLAFRFVDVAHGIEARDLAPGAV